jgi:hypothetical protein
MTFMGMVEYDFNLILGIQAFLISKVASSRCNGF